MPNTQPIKHPAKPQRQLWQCESLASQKAWVHHALSAGMVLSDARLWLGGCDPKTVITALRKDGVAITTTKKKVADADGVVRNDLAWRMTQDAVAAQTRTPK